MTLKTITTRTCDRCGQGREAEKSEIAGWGHLTAVTFISPHNGKCTHEKADLCLDCLTDFMKWWCARGKDVPNPVEGVR